MINTITQVSPGNRVDFSKIRKASQGIKIPKFLTPSGGIQQWYLDRYAQNNTLGGWNSSLDSSKAGETIVGQGNSSLHGKAGDLNAAWTGNQAYTSNSERVGQDIQYWVDEWIKQNPNATDDQIVNAYNQIALQIRDYLSQGHTYNSRGAATNNRAFKTMFSSRSLKSDPNYDMSGDQAFIGYQDSGDDIYGSSSFLRRMDLYEKEYDDLTDDEKTARTHTIKVGDRDVQVYKKANGDISLLSSGGGDGSGTGGGNGGGGSSEGQEIEQETPGDYTPDDYYNFQFKPEPFLTPNPFIAGLGLAANKHQYDNEMQKRVPLLKAPRVERQVTNDYAGQLILNLQMADIRSQAQRQLGSDMTQNQQYLLAVEQGLQPLINQSAAARTLAFNVTTKDHQDALNQSNIWSAQYGNLNISNLVAGHNAKLDAKSKYLLIRNELKSDSLSKTFTDYTNWSANEKAEEDSAIEAYENWLANIKIQNAKKPYYDLASDPMKSRSFDTIYQQAFNDFNSNLGSDRTWANANPELDKIFGDNNLDQNAKRQAVLDYLRTSNSDYATAFNKGWNSELNTVRNNAIAATQDIQNQLAGTYPWYRNTYVGGWGPWDRRRLGRMHRPIFSKNGGILKMKNGSRFVDYLEHNRKVIKDQDQTTMEVSKQMERKLKALLESLDRETLILLRSIFK